MIRFPHYLYVGSVTRGNPQSEERLAFITPYDYKPDSKEPDPATKSRIKTVNAWINRGNQRNKETKIVENKPRMGFSIGRSISRWSTKNKVVRVYDPLGFECEISIANLVHIISEGKLEKGVIKNECRWARSGSENWLLVSGSELYREASGATKLKSSMASMNDVQFLDTVDFLNGETMVYLGKLYVIFRKSFNFPSQYRRNYDEIPNFFDQPVRKTTSYHAFGRKNGTVVITKTPKISRTKHYEGREKTTLGMLPKGFDPENVIAWINEGIRTRNVSITSFGHMDGKIAGVSDIKTTPQFHIDDVVFRQVYNHWALYGVKPRVPEEFTRLTNFKYFPDHVVVLHVPENGLISTGKTHVTIQLHPVSGNFSIQRPSNYIRYAPNDSGYEEQLTDDTPVYCQRVEWKTSNGKVVMWTPFK